ncbi:hypothetical protein A5776_09420 [Mycolicibacterium elephantis]|nr:hypothetical protein A5776_09420 [Mycolicibacterium elephantis]
MISHMINQPPARFAISVPLHGLSSCPTLARLAATVVTGTRNPSVNSSERPSSSARNPIEKASPAIRWLCVTASSER